MYASTRLSNRPHSSYIKMSDFIRIQNSIIPSKNNETNRKDIDASLKTQSKFHISHFPDTTKQTQKEYEEETYIQNEKYQNIVSILRGIRDGYFWLCTS